MPGWVDRPRSGALTGSQRLRAARLTSAPACRFSASHARYASRVSATSASGTCSCRWKSERTRPRCFSSAASFASSDASHSLRHHNASMVMLTDGGSRCRAWQRQQVCISNSTGIHVQIFICHAAQPGSHVRVTRDWNKAESALPGGIPQLGALRDVQAAGDQRALIQLAHALRRSRRACCQLLVMVPHIPARTEHMPDVGRPIRVIP